MSEQTIYITLSCVYILVTLVFVTNRLYVRILSRGQVVSTHIATNISDALVVIAWLFKVAQTICDAVMYAKNAMVDPSLLDAKTEGNAERIDNFQELYYIQTALYYIPLYCIKGAILCYLLEITPELLKRIRRLIYTGLILTVIGAVFAECVYFASCKTVKFWWSTSYHYGVCRIAQITMPCSVIYHILTDLYIYTIPFFLLSKLRIITLGQKLATGSMFGAGFLLICLAVGTAAPVRGMWGYWFGLHEQSWAITVACLPSLRITFLKWSGCRRHSTGSVGHRSLGRKLRRGELVTREVGEGDEIVPTKAAHLSDEEDGKGSVILPHMPELCYDIATYPRV